MAIKKQNSEEQIVEETNKDLQNDGKKVVVSEKPKKEEGTRLS